MNQVIVPERFSLVHLLEVDSTNEEAKRNAKDIDGDTVFWSDMQSSGRGRLGRDWVSEEGNLFYSLFLRPNCTLAKASQLSFVAAVAVRDAIAELYPKRDDINLKWPNDILFGKKKVAGILLESASSGDTPDWVFVGVGVNIASYTKDVRWPASCLTSFGVDDISVSRMLELNLHYLDFWLNIWEKDGFQPIYEEWIKHAAHIDKMISVSSSGGDVKAICRGMNKDGGLLLELEDGTTMSIAVGEVYF